MKKLVTIILLTSLSSSAFALGDKEKGVLLGIAGTLLGQELIQNHQHRNTHHHPHGHGSTVYVPRGYTSKYLEGVRDGYTTRIQAEIEDIRARERRMEYRIYACGVSHHNCDRVTSWD